MAEQGVIIKQGQLKVKKKNLGIWIMKWLVLRQQKGDSQRTLELYDNNHSIQMEKSYVLPAKVDARLVTSSSEARIVSITYRKNETRQFLAKNEIEASEWMRMLNLSASFSDQPSPAAFTASKVQGRPASSPYPAAPSYPPHPLQHLQQQYPGNCTLPSAARYAPPSLPAHHRSPPGGVVVVGDAASSSSSSSLLIDRRASLNSSICSRTSSNSSDYNNVVNCFRVQMLPNSKLHYSDEVILQIVNKQIKVTETAPPFSEYTSWPFSYIRNYNHGDDIFNFECGRSSDTGEGHFYFYSSQAETIFNLVHSTSLAISQRMRESRNEPPKIEAPPPPSNTRRTTQYPVQSPATPLSAGARTPGYPYFPSDASTTSSSTTGDFAHAPSPPLPARPPPMESLTNAGGGPPRSDLQHHQHRPSNASLQSAGGMPPSRPSASSLVREVPPIPASYTPGQPSPSLPPRPDTSSTTSRQHQLQQQHQQQQQLNRAPPTRRSEGYPAGHAQMPGQATPTSASSAKPPPFSQKSLPSQVGNFPVVDVNERPLPPIPLKEGYLKYHTQVM